MGQYFAQITQTTLVLSHWRRGQVLEHHSFESADGERALDSFLGDRKMISVAVLLDLPNERFFPGSAPHVRGADGRRLRSRELHRAFPGSDCCRAECQDRRSEGRRDDRVLYSGFDESGPGQNWLGIFLRHSVRISRLYSPALLAPFVLRYLTIQPPRCVLLVTRGLAGFRQTVLVDGWTRFSRIFEVDLSAPDRFWADLEQERTRVIDHLRSQALLDLESPLVTVVVSDPMMLPDVPPLPPPDTIVAGVKPSRQPLCAATDLAVADHLALLALASWRLPPGYPLQDVFRELALKTRVRQYASRVAWGLIMAGVVMLAAQYARMEMAAQKLAELDKAILELANQNERASRQFPSHWPSLAQMQKDMTMHRQLQRYGDSLLEMLDTLSIALIENPQVVIDSLTWTIADAPDSATKSVNLDEVALSRYVLGDVPTVRMDISAHLRDPSQSSLVREMKAVQSLSSKLAASGLKATLSSQFDNREPLSRGKAGPVDSQSFRFEVRSAL